jgi:hypothetical protein
MTTLASLATQDTDARRRAILQTVIDNGVEFRRAAIVGAISFEETGLNLAAPRSPSLPFPLPCYPMRQILILEAGAESRRTAMRQSWVDDDEILGMLRDRGVLVTEPDGSMFVSSDVTGLTDSVERPNDELAFIFEWLLDRRKADALAAFSIGPTQCNLRFGSHPDIVKERGATGFAGRFSSFEQLGSFYFSTTVVDLMTSEFFDYLKTNNVAYPVEGVAPCGLNYAPQTDFGPVDAACIEAYMTQFQTGFAFDWTSNKGRIVATLMAKGVNDMWATARAMGISVG